MKHRFILFTLLLLGLALPLATSANTQAADEEITTGIDITPSNATCKRGGTSVVTSGWFSTIVTNTSPEVTVTAAVNNISLEGDSFILAEGSATTYSFTISAPEGFLIESMMADVTSKESNPTISFGSNSTTTGIEPQHLVAEDVYRRTLTIKMSSTAQNAKAMLSNWRVNLVSGEASTDPHIKYSTDEEQHWYYIYSTSDKKYCTDKVWYYDADNDRMKFGDKAFKADRIWSFWKNDAGKIAIMNYNGIYVGTAPTGSGNATQFGKATSANYIYSVNYLTDGQFTISDGKGQPLHAQESGSVLVRYTAEVNNASTWNFEKVSIANPEARIGQTIVEQGKVTTGIGNTNCPILRSTLIVTGLEGEVRLEGVKGKIVASNLADVKAVRAYFATNSRELFIDDAQTMSWRENNGILFAEGSISDDGTYTITGEKCLPSGEHYLWIALDIAPNAKEGNTVDATITSYTVNGSEMTEKNGNPQYDATIFLTESAALMPMDMGSLYYRIPAITTSADGKRLVVLTDDRKAHNSDLPSHCYVVAQYSEDGGRSWTQPLTVAGTDKTGGNYGHGDASLITNRINGEIIGIMTCSTNGNGYFGSTPDKPQTWKTITSKDGGKTWSVPKDHTKELYGTGSPNPTWLGGFSGSGAGLQKRDGTLVSPFVNRESPTGANVNTSQNYYNFMSKDGGKTWYVSGVRGSRPADEPKVLERNNGDLAISVRQTGYNLHNVTTDDGATWKNGDGQLFDSGISGNACDGEYMYWCSKLDGNPWNIVFQTCPNHSNRQNLSIALSTDEGEKFGNPKPICPRGSAYSAATVLPDGTVGVYYEENGLFGGYTMRFVRFSLDWASNGKYKFSAARPYHPIQSHVELTAPANGVGTIVLPFAADIPEGMSLYECSDEVTTFTEDGVDYVGTTLQPVESGRLEGFHPYVYYAEGGTEFIFDRPLDQWEAQALPANCEATAGALQGWMVNESIKGDGVTMYSVPKSSDNGDTFNRLSKVTSKMTAYTANFVHPFTEEDSPAAVRILSDHTNAIEAITSGDATPAIYDLGGRKVLAMPIHGTFIKDGKKIIR